VKCISLIVTELWLRVIRQFNCSLLSCEFKRCLQLLEISWNLDDAPEKLSNVIFRRFSVHCTQGSPRVGSQISKRVGWHNDERSSELILTCSFIDISFTCILILYGLSHKKSSGIFFNVTWIFPGNWLGWICSHPGLHGSVNCVRQCVHCILACINTLNQQLTLQYLVFQAFCVDFLFCS